MNEPQSLQIPDLRRLDPRREDARRAALYDRAAKSAAPLIAALRAAAPKAAAAALIAGGAFGGGRAYQAWRDARLALGGVQSTIHPESHAGGGRLALASESSHGELAWSQAAAPASTGAEPAVSTEAAREGRALAWAEALRLAKPGGEARSTARAVSPSASAQLRAGLALSTLASGSARAEDAAEIAHGAFSQQLTLAAKRETLVDALVTIPKQISTLPAPDVAASGKNVTPYQEMLDEAYGHAREAGVLRRKAPASLAAGAALLAAGRAMLGVPGAGLAARGLLAAGAAATARGVRQIKQAKEHLGRAQYLVEGIHVLQGQKYQAGLAEACVEALAGGAKLDRCSDTAPAMAALTHATLNRELASSTWEVEGGRPMAALPE